MLDRRIDRWVRLQPEDADRTVVEAAAAAARLAARSVVLQLKSAGALDDATFAAQRAGSLARSGRSSRAVQSHLLARGIDASLISQAVAGQVDELPSALIYLRRRRLGGFRAGEADDETRRKEFAALARAGFSAEVARRALRLSSGEATDIIARFRRGEALL